MAINTFKESLNLLDAEMQVPENFVKYGVFVKKKFFDDDQVNLLQKKVRDIIGGSYKTGIQPDKVKYSKMSDGSNYIHSLCNGWKADAWVKNLFQTAGFLQYVSLITPWECVKLNQDTFFSVLPKSNSATSFHQDNAYQNWHTSKGGVVTAWIALSETKSNSGGIEYLLGSHKMNCDIRRLDGEFIVSKNNSYEELDKRFGSNWSTNYKLYRPDLSAGDVVFHHGLLWHGSCPNLSDQTRLSVSLHLMDGGAEFSGIDVNPVFNKFKLDGSNEMNSSFFPVLS